MNEWCGVEHFMAIGAIALVVKVKYVPPPPSKPLPWPHPCLYVNRFYRDDSLKLKSTQTEK